MSKKKVSKAKTTKPATRDQYTGSGKAFYYDGGYGNRSHECTDCGGSGRVYEGGYGMTRCPSC